MDQGQTRIDETVFLFSRQKLEGGRHHRHLSPGGRGQDLLQGGLLPAVRPDAGDLHQLPHSGLGAQAAGSRLGPLHHQSAAD